MQIMLDPRGWPADRQPVVALGNFDGLHLGHRAILDVAISRARAAGTPAFALTFDPLPARVLAPERAPKLLLTPRDKLDLLAASGIDAVLVVPFDLALSRVSARDFVGDYLKQRLGVRCVVVGYSVSFGHGRAGNAGVMCELGEVFGFKTEVVGPVQVDGREVSSTRIRQAIEAGELRSAARMLGRHHFLRGRVVRGRRRGHEIGFPTANLDSETECIPPDGVYATRLRADGEAWPAITNIGMRPTFNELVRSIETHIFNFDRELYGAEVRLELVERIRPERKFESGEALGRQITLDVARVKEILAAV